MNDFTGLNAQEMEHLIFTIETSLKINKRFQFFLWAQGSLQGFIPHETMVCAYGDVLHGNYRCESFSRNTRAPASEAHLCDTVDGPLPRIVDDWLDSGCEPRLYGSEASPGDSPVKAGKEAVAWHGAGNAVAHGAKEMQGEFGSFFAFLQVPQPPSARDAYLLEIFMPYLHMALHRMLANESSEEGGKLSPESLLSKREMQVLEWVRDGKTNHEIGHILSISPLTVKNHVQKILRKLNVSNRAQAVGKGAASRLFAPKAGDGRREVG